MNLAACLNPLKPEKEMEIKEIIEIKEIKKIENSTKEKDDKKQKTSNTNTNNNVKKIISNSTNKDNKKIEPSKTITNSNNNNSIIISQSRYSSNESHIKIDNIGDLNIKKQTNEENDEIIHFNNEGGMENNRNFTSKRRNEFESSVRPIDKKETDNNINRKGKKIDNTNNLWQKADNTILNRISESDEIMIISDNNISVSSKLSEASKKRKKHLEKSIKDVSVEKKVIRSNLKADNKLTKSKSVTKN